LLAGLISLGGALWFGVNYSMVAAVDDLLAARVEHLVAFVDAELGGDLPQLSHDGDQGERRGEIEQIDSSRESFLLNGARIRLTPKTTFEGYGDEGLKTGQYVAVAVEKDETGKWLATHVALEMGFWEELQEDLHEYALSVPEGRLIHIRMEGGPTLLPAQTTLSEQTPIPWQDSTGAETEYLTVETRDGAFRVLTSRAQVAGSPCRIQVASSLAAVTATRERLFSWVLWAVPAGLFLSISGGYAISRAALRPVEKVAGVAGRMDVRRLSERLEVPATGDVVQRLAETFNGMLSRLETSVRRLEEFTADASHELRSPVSVIRTTAELALRQDRTAAELRKDMQEIQGEAAHLTELIEDLLTLARADSGAGASPMSDVDLGALVDEVASQYSRTIGERQLHVEIAETDTIVTGHVSSLKRLLVILLDNAVQHTPADASIWVAVRGEGAVLVLSVADTGEGIPPEDMNRLFDRFYRVDSSRNRSKGGFGLGLSIAKWIVESHGGSIKVASDAGKGTTFSTRLARRRRLPLS